MNHFHCEGCGGCVHTRRTRAGNPALDTAVLVVAYADPSEEDDEALDVVFCGTCAIPIMALVSRLMDDRDRRSKASLN